MEENRKVRRQRVLKAGTISFNHGAGIDCTIRNLSSAGACLEVASPLGIPDEFILFIESDQTQHLCQVEWQREKQIGVCFKHERFCPEAPKL
jgi:PilZ domain